MSQICNHNPATKKAFKALLEVKKLYVLNTYTGNQETGAGTFVIEGPREYHKWYAKATTNEKGEIIKIS